MFDRYTLHNFYTNVVQLGSQKNKNFSRHPSQVVSKIIYVQKEAKRIEFHTLHRFQQQFMLVQCAPRSTIYRKINSSRDRNRYFFYLTYVYFGFSKKKKKKKSSSKREEMLEEIAKLRIRLRTIKSNKSYLRRIIFQIFALKYIRILRSCSTKASRIVEDWRTARTNDVYCTKMINVV